MGEELGSVGLQASPVSPSRASSDEPATPSIRMNLREHAVLAALAEAGPEMCFAFAPICKLTGLDRAHVRLACRSLARKGAAHFAKGLWTEDGDPRGSGYGLTAVGLLIAQGALEPFAKQADECEALYTKTLPDEMHVLHVSLGECRAAPQALQGE